MAEWLAGVVLISIAVPTQGASSGYQKTMTTIMYRLTALTAVFFVLALMANSRAGKVAVYAGLLIDLGIIFTAWKEGSIDKFGAAISGKPLSGEGAGHGPPIVPEANIFPSAPPISGGWAHAGSGGNSSSGGEEQGVPA